MLFFFFFFLQTVKPISTVSSPLQSPPSHSHSEELQALSQYPSCIQLDGQPSLQLGTGHVRYNCAKKQKWPHQVQLCKERELAMSGTAVQRNRTGHVRYSCAKKKELAMLGITMQQQN